MEILTARAYEIVKMTRNLDEAAQRKRSKTVRNEIMRLAQQPQLFPSRSIGRRFYEVIHPRTATGTRHSSRNFEMIVNNLLHQQVWEGLKTDWEYLRRPTYKRHHTAWEQFLLDRSPGLSDKPSAGSPTISVQFVPAAGLRIGAQAMREITELMDQIRQVCRSCPTRELVTQC